MSSIQTHALQKKGASEKAGEKYFRKTVIFG